MPDLIDMSQYPDRDEHEPYYIALVKMNAVIAEAASPTLAAENNRRTQLAGLVEGAVGTPAAELVSALFRHYKEEAAEYVQIGGSVLGHAVQGKGQILIPPVHRRCLPVASAGTGGLGSQA